MNLDVRIVKKEPKLTKMCHMWPLDIGVIVASLDYAEYNGSVIIALKSAVGNGYSWFSLNHPEHSWENLSGKDEPNLEVRLLQPGEQLIIERKED